MFPGLTAEAVIRSTLEWAVGLSRMMWTTLIRPYPWFWVVVLAALIVMRVWPASRRP